MSTRRLRLPSGRPRKGLRPRKRRYLVVTNGEVTEPQYFRVLEEELGDVVIEVRSFRDDPAKLAEHAADLKSRDERSRRGQPQGSEDGFLRVYVVTDVDQFPPVQLRDAQKTCRRAGMALAISNPCFEVWLIDHFLACPASCCDARMAERKALELGAVGGSRNKHVNAEALAGRSKDACSNARIHNSAEREDVRKRLDSCDFAPWTDMDKLVEEISQKPCQASR